MWPYEDYLYQGGERLMKDLFTDGYVDHAIFQPAYLGEFYKTGFGQTEEAFALTQANPDKLTYNHNFDPRNGEAGLDQLRADAERFNLKGVKLYTAEWHGESRGWKLSDPWAYRYFELCRELGIKNIHVHKGPTIRPLDRDAFDVSDVDHVATDFTDLNFIIEHVGLPRMEDFCWIATQEPNVWGGLAVAMPFMHTRPRYFAQILGDCSTGSVRTGSPSPPTTRSGRRAGWWSSSWTSRSRRTSPSTRRSPPSRRRRSSA